ncbi:hypothetical protein Tco_1522906 [Tanacetum coccineum]
MSYPRFIKIIIDYFMSKDQSISRRNKMFWYTARDDNLFTSMRCISRHENTQVYGTILPKELTNQAMLESKAYKTYYTFASGEKTPKPKYVRKKADSDTSPKQKPSKVSDEQHLKTTSADEGIDEDDENDSDDISDEEGDDTNDDDDETDSDRTESDRIKIPVLDQSTTEYYEEEEKIDDEETMDDDEDDVVTMELYEDVNMNLGNQDTKMADDDHGASEQRNVSQESVFEQVKEDAYVTITPVLDTQKADEPVQSSFISSEFTSKLLNLENPSLADNKIASLMETSARHAMAVPKITSGFTTTIPPPPPFFNPLPQQTTPTLTPTASEATTSFPLLSDFSSVFRFNDRVTNLEKDQSEIKQVNQYAQVLSSIPAIVDRYIDNKQLVDTSMRAMIKEEEVNTQLPQILPQAVSDFANHILLEKIEESKSHLRAYYKKKLYDALVESYNSDKDLFDSYGEVFSLKRSRDDIDKDQDPSAGSDRGTKRRKSNKDAESSRDLRSKEKKSSSTSKDTSQSQHKSSGKSAHAEEPNHTVDDSGNKRQHVDSRPPQAWISQVSRAKEPRTSFYELIDTSFNFSTFVPNRLNIKDLTQEILVGPAFELLKGTCKSLTELDYHLEECSKATTE